MIKIYSGGDIITYTLGDSFEISVSSAEGFEEGMILKLKIAKSELEPLLIDTSFELENTEFNVTLTDEEKDKLPIGEYIYKLVLISKYGEIITQKSGEFIVKWGA